jgi:TolB-like protein/tetratricopeptide (TPR) repeat protein/tRNA A-37 threonylcarbamoyl transferase component Bud32
MHGPFAPRLPRPALSDPLLQRLQPSLGDAYDIERELGGGGMSRVFVARDRALDRAVVLKVFPPETSAGISAERFEREIRVSARLQHPHIVPLLSAGEADSLPYYTMPFIEGESLRARLEREGPLPVPTAVRILSDVADALTAAHQAGVAHRDIKPANVLMSGEHALVADFGVARALTEAADEGHGLTTAGTAIGTPAYMAPEQAGGEPGMDHRVDIYALGVLGYELLTGRTPFHGLTPQQTLLAQATRMPAPVRELRTAVPPRLEALLMRCLEKQPADRPQTAEEVARALDALGVADGAIAAPGSMRGLARTMATAAAGGALLAAAVFGIRALLGDGRPTASDALASHPVVAVLPFDDIGGDPGNEYFSEGITDDIIAQLSKVGSLSVISRTSAMAYRGSEKSTREIGSDLGAGALLRGSVRRAGSRVRVVAQLVDADTDATVWAETYDRELEDVFAIQSDISERIARSLEATLSPETLGRIEAQPTEDLVAYELYLQGRFFWNKRTPTDLERALSFFRQAVERDSTMALAWSGLADTWLVFPFFTDSAAATTLPRARRAAERALSLDPQLGEAHTTLAYLLMLQDWAWAAADSAFGRAIALNPGYATAYKWYTDLLQVVGRRDEARAAIERALELDPLSPNVMTILGYCYWVDGQDREAGEWYERALALDAGFPLALGYASKLYFALGDTARFFSTQARLDAASTRAGAPVEELRRAYADDGWEAVLRTQISWPGAEGLPWERARWNAQLGDLDAAFRDLERAFAERSVWIPFVSVFPDLEPVRGDPRYGVLLERMGLRSDELRETAP